MEDELDGIKSIVDEVIGEPKSGDSGYGGWLEYNCPMCAKDNGDVPDDKYNFAVSLESGWGHCWKCSYHPKLYGLIKNFGTSGQLSDFKQAVESLRSKRDYTFLDDNEADSGNSYKFEEVKLPENFRSLSSCPNCVDKFDAIEYLHSRGVSDDIISFYNIGYVGGQFCKDFKLKHKVFIPSYDSFGELNYWAGRDYTGKSKMSKVNPLLEKTKIVFNEGKVNWYEPVTLVEGPFDHISVPNSIPLLGKVLSKDGAVFDAILKNVRTYVNVFLDNDAEVAARKLYRMLNKEIPGRVRFIKSPDGYDPSDILRDYGKRGILDMLRSSYVIPESDFLFE